MSYFRSISQNVLPDENNSSIANINAGATWNSAGAGSSTLGVAGIQVNIHMDQNATVYIDQSMDQTNWDIVDSFNFYSTSVGNSWTIQATASYVRVRVKNTGTATATDVRIQTALCPIVEALPRALDKYGFLKTCVETIDSKFGDYQVTVSPMGSLKTATSTRLIGASFTGGTLDSNFWANTPTNGGTVTLGGGETTLNPNTTANGAILLQSHRTARYTSASPNYFRAIVVLPAVTTSTGTNTRRWGAYDATDGFFFVAAQANAASSPVLSLVCRKTSSDANIINSGSFNGDQGATFLLDNNVHTYEIYWTNSKAWFSIDGQIIHTFTGSTATLVDTTHLKISAESINAGNNNVNNTLVVRTASINRLGNLLTQPMIRYQSGTTAGVIAKIGPGNLHSVIIASPVSGSVVTLYDGTTTGGTVLFSATLTWTTTQSSNFPYSLDFKGIPFNTGLFLVIATQNCNVTLIYE